MNIRIVTGMAIVVISILSFLWIKNNEDRNLQVVKGEFIDLIYYSGSIDVYIDQNGAEHKYRIENSEEIYPKSLSVLTDADLPEGPPGPKAELIGKQICITLNKEKKIRSLSLLESDNNSCE